MWGYVGANNRGWYGSGQQTRLYRNILDPAPVPIPFSPTDLSDCVLWLDANDGDTVQTTEDTSGVNLNRVLKWFDKAQPSNQNYYKHVGDPAGSGLYNTHTMNQLKTIYFEPYAYMAHQGNGIEFSFQARTFFAVVKSLTDLTTHPVPFVTIYSTTSASNFMQTVYNYEASEGGFYQFAMCAQGVSCPVIFRSPGEILNQRMLVMWANTDAEDLSGNRGAFDTISQTLYSSQPASYATGTSQYWINNPFYGTSQDVAEIIMYRRLLTTTEQTRVLDYLADKWALSGPSGSGANSDPVP